MTREEAIRILDMKTSAKALVEIEYYNGFSDREAALKAVDDACVLAVAALREQEERRCYGGGCHEELLCLLQGLYGQIPGLFQFL